MTFWKPVLRRAVANWLSPVSVLCITVSSLAWIWIPRLCLHADGVLTRTEVTLSKVYATASNVDKATAIWAQSSQDQAAAVTSLVKQASAATLSAQHAADAATGILAVLQTQADALGPILSDSDMLVKNLALDAALLKEDEESLHKLLLTVDGQVAAGGPKAQAILAATQTLADQTAKTMTDVRTVTDRLADPHTSKWSKFRAVWDLIWKAAMLAK